MQEQKKTDQSETGSDRRPIIGRYDRKPLHDVRVRTSKDGRFIMVDSVETWIFPAQYFRTVLGNAANSATAFGKGHATAPTAM